MGTFIQIDFLSLFLDPPSHFLFPTPRYDHTFELYSESERLYLFGTDDPESHKDWVKSIAKVSKLLLRSVRPGESLEVMVEKSVSSSGWAEVGGLVWWSGHLCLVLSVSSMMVWTVRLICGLLRYNQHMVYFF